MNAVIGKRRAGRPSSARFGVIGVSDGDGGSLTWSDGQWAGAPHLAAVRKLIADGVELVVPGTGGHTIKADGNDPVAVMAIMAAVTGMTTGFRGDVPLAAIIALARQPLPVGTVA